MEKKYIIFDESLPVIFSGAHTHSNVAAGYLGKPTSAGFFYTSIDSDRINVTCFGRSESLKLDSKKSDNFYIELLLNGKRDW